MKKHVIIYCILLLVISSLFSFIILTAQKNEGNNLPPYIFEDSNSDYDYNISLFTEYYIFNKELNLYDNYTAIVNYDKEMQYINYEVTSTEYNIGDIITKEAIVGYNNDEIIKSNVNGRLISKETVEDIITITILNAESFDIVISIHQSKFFDIDFDVAKFYLELPNGEELELVLNNITYEIINGYLEVTFDLLNINYDILPNIDVSVKHLTSVDECNYWISSSIFTSSSLTYRENTYYTFIIKYLDSNGDYVYEQKEIKVGRIIDGMLGVYVENDNHTLLVKKWFGY